MLLRKSLGILCLVVLSVSHLATAQPPTSPPPPELLQKLQQAQALFGQQDFAGAEKLLETTTQAFSTRAAAWYLLGYARHAQKHYDSAMTAYEQANKLAQGKAPNTLYNMACIHAVKGDAEKAFASLDAAVEAGFGNFSQLATDPELVNLRNDPRFLQYQPKWLSDDELFIEQSRIIHKWDGEAAGDQFGWTARRVGDVDQDGVVDFVTTAPTFQGGAGKIYVYSSKSGELLHSIAGGKGYRLGNSAVGLDDVNGDNIPDFIAGAPNANGQGLAIVYSGKDASVLLQLSGATALTSAWSAVQGLKTGRVFIVAGKKYAPPADTEARKLKATHVETLVDEIDGGSGGLNIDAQGNLYTADFGWRLDGKGKGGHQLFKIAPDGTARVFSTALRGGSGNTIDDSGNILQSSIGGNFISKISPDGKVSTYCDSGLKSPVGLALDSQGNLFACNCGNNTIQRILPNGESSVFSQSSLLNCPNGITVGPDDTLYVCNFSNGDVLRIDRDGKVCKAATLPGGNNGHLIYHRGFLYVLARKDCRVYQVDLAGRVEVFAGNGTRGSGDGQPLEASFSLPNSLSIDANEKWMYVNEVSPTSGDHRILGPTRIRRIALSR